MASSVSYPATVISSHPVERCIGDKRLLDLEFRGFLVEHPTAFFAVGERAEHINEKPTVA
jgi:hypothetical protein